MTRKLTQKILLLLALPVLFMLVPMASAHRITVPTNAYFGLPSLGTYINFNTQQTFDQIYRESSYWYFDGYGFQVQNANMTITDLFVSDGNKLIFTVTGNSGTTSTTKVYCGDKGKPRILRVDGITQTYDNGWTYDDSSKVATISIIHSSSAQVVLDWSEEAPPAGDGAEVKYSLTVTVVDEDGIEVEGAIVTVWRDTTSVASRLTNEDGVAKFTLTKGPYLVTAEGSPRVGTTSVTLDASTSVTITLSEPSGPLDILEGIGETFIEPAQSLMGQFVQSFLFILVGFAFMPVGATVSWYGVSEEENWIKIVGFLTALLGAFIIVYAFVG